RAGSRHETEAAVTIANHVHGCRLTNAPTLRASRPAGASTADRCRVSASARASDATGTRRLLALRIIPGHQITQCGLAEGEHGYGAYDLGDVLGERAVAVLHGVHLNPGNATPAHDALAGRFERDARDGVLGDDHRPPFLNPAFGPDPHRVAGVDGCWLIDRTPTPIVGAARGQ